MEKSFLQIKFRGEQELRKARNCISDYVREVLTVASESEKYLMEVAFNEALNNALRHSISDKQKRNPLDRPVTITVYTNDEKELVMRISDLGPGFDAQGKLLQLEKRLNEENDIPEEELWAESGRGLLLMRAAVDKVYFNRRGNSVTMCKKLTC